MSTTVEEVHIAAPELRGAALELGACRDIEVCLDGPAGTGKTVGILFKIHMLLWHYPGARWLVARKSNTDLAGSAMATYRDAILDPNEGVEYFGGNKVKPAAYMYPNGSMMIVNGLDRAEKVKSWEFDGVYINEATECGEEDIQFVRSRLRHGKMPYHQLIMDVNPGPPNHWLNQRMIDGKTRRLISRHEDNPRYFDLKTNDWTPAGRDYIFGILEGLTGVLKLRLRNGIWAAAEGMVYETWDSAVHVVSKKKLVEWGIFTGDGMLNRQVVKSVLASVDWGYTNPGVIHVWALDGDTRMYLICEIYRTQQVIDWWIEQATELRNEYGIELFVCDPAEPSYIDQFNAHQLHAVGAINDIAPGISALQSRLKVAGDGRARFYVYEYALRGRDESRVSARKPYSFTQEVDGYVWPKSKDGMPVKEVPVKVDDHAMDCARYMAMWLTDPTPTGGMLIPETTEDYTSEGWF